MEQNFKIAIVFSAVMIVMLTLNSCQKEEAKLKKENNNTTAEVSKLPVDVIVAQETDLNQEEVVVGTMVPNQDVAIVSETAQKIKRIVFTDGTNVSRGQLLYKLNDADLKAKLKELHAELKLAKLNEQRLGRLLKMESVRKQDYDDVVMKMQSLQAQEEFLQFQLSKTEIRAPFSGRIGISKVHLGSYVTPGLPLVNLQDQSVMKINFSLPEKYLLQVKKGSLIGFTTQLSTQQNVAIMEASESGLDEANRNLKVQAIAANPKGEFKGGMSAKIHFTTGKEGAKGIKIPSEALIPGDKGYNVYVVIDGVAKSTPVVIANRTESEAIIVSGINTGDAIVVSNILRLGDGIPVTAIPSK